MSWNELPDDMRGHVTPQAENFIWSRDFHDQLIIHPQSTKEAIGAYMHLYMESYENPELPEWVAIEPAKLAYWAHSTEDGALAAVQMLGEHEFIELRTIGETQWCRLRPERWKARPNPFESKARKAKR
jgi:hypothetical protein